MTIENRALQDGFNGDFSSGDLGEVVKKSRDSVMKTIAMAFAVAVALASGTAASAQSIDPGGSKTLDITADELEVQNKLCMSIWRGRAEALQGRARLRADVLKAYFQPQSGTAASGASAGSAANGSCGNLLRIEAEGAVYYLTGDDQRVRGDAGTYDATATTFTMTGDVIAVQGPNVLRGSRMVFNTQTGEGRMVGAATGAKSGLRPRGVFYPSSKQQGGAGN